MCKSILSLACGIASVALLLGVAGTAQALDTGIITFEDLTPNTGSVLDQVSTPGFTWLVNRRTSNQAADFGTGAPAIGYIENGVITNHAGSNGVADSAEGTGVVLDGDCLCDASGTYGNVLIPGPNEKIDNATVAQGAANNSTNGLSTISMVLDEAVTTGSVTLAFDVFFRDTGDTSLSQNTRKNASGPDGDGNWNLSGGHMDSTWNQYGRGAGNFTWHDHPSGTGGPDNDGNRSYPTSVSAGEWSSVVQRWDIDAGTWSMSVDGTTTFTDEPHSNTGALAAIDFTYRGNQYWPKFFIDNVRVTPEPTTALVVGAGMMLAFVGRRRQS